MTCPNCGTPNPATAKFCQECATPLSSASSPQAIRVTPARHEFRKTVSILFCDLVGSTPLGERIDPEALRALMLRYFGKMTGIIEGHGGTIEKFAGDAIMAVFGVPVVHEDDAIRAVRAAVQMREASAALNVELLERWGVELHTRTGVYTGPVVAGMADDTVATGDAVNIAARMEQSAGTDEILIGEVTHRLTRDATEVVAVEPLSLKGKSDRVPAYRVLSASEHAPGTARRMDSTLVGRDEQLAAVSAALHRAGERQTPVLVTVAGDPGVGKSRLIEELIQRAGDRWVVLRGGCLPYGEGVGTWPLREAIQAAAQISPSDLAAVAIGKIATLAGDERTATQIAQLIGITHAEAPAHELFGAVRLMIERMAARRPVLFAIDDLHWAAPSMLGLIEHLARWTEAPLLLTATARREFIRELRPDWGAGFDAVTVELSPLDEGDSETLVGNLLGQADIPIRVRDKIVRTSEGNPLFVQEFLSMLVDDGSLVPDGERWVATRDLRSIDVPPTITALLAARVERLGAPERADAERAAVQGQSFSLEPLLALSPLEVRDQVNKHLVALADAELIEADRADGPDYHFRHVLIRDTVYDGALKEVRADLHERFADWLEATSGELGFDDMLGYHLEQAYRLRIELGPARDAEHVLANRAATYLARAGRRALSLADMAEAASLLTRAAELLPADAHERAALLPNLAEALVDGGEFAAARGALDVADAAAAASGDSHLAAWSALIRADLELYTQPDDWANRTAAVISDAMTSFEQAGDELGLARACGDLAFVHMYRCDAGGAAGWALRAAEHADRAGAYGGRHLATYASALLYGPMPADEGLARCNELLAREDLGSAARAPALQTRGALLAMRGDFDAAVRSIEEGAVLDQQLGRDLACTMAKAELLAATAMLAGNAEAADAHLVEGYEILTATGERAYASTLSAMRSRVLCAAGRFEEAEAAAAISRDDADVDDIVVQVLWRGGMARAQAARGDLESGLALANEAVALAEGTDHITMLAEAHQDLAEVLIGANHPDDAKEHLDIARDLHTQKGDRSALAALDRGR